MFHRCPVLQQCSAQETLLPSAFRTRNSDSLSLLSKQYCLTAMDIAVVRSIAKFMHTNSLPASQALSCHCLAA